MILISFVFAMLVPLMAPLIAGIWSVFLIRFGWLPFLLERSELAVQKENVTRNVTQAILKIGVIVIPAIVLLCWNARLLRWLEGLGTVAVMGERNFNIIWAFLYSSTWLILIVEMWLGLLCYFGLHYLLSFLGGLIDQRQHISRYIAMTMLLIGGLTVLIGFGRWLYTGTANWPLIEEAQNFGSVVLSPTTSLLTIGMVVILYISLRKSLTMEENIEQSKGIAKEMIVAVLLTFIILGIVGSILSITIHIDRQHGFESIR